MHPIILILSILGTAAASHKYPHGGPPFPGCSKVIEVVDSAHQQSQATAFCRSYLPSWSASAVTKRTTTTIRTSTTVTHTTSVAATSLVTSCAIPTGTTPAKREARSTPKPQAWSDYPLGIFISSACSCLRPARSTTTQTITKTSITSTVTSVSTVVTGTTTVNAVPTFSIYGIRPPPAAPTGVYFYVEDYYNGVYVPELNIAFADDGSEFTLLSNGSLVIVAPGFTFLTSTQEPDPAGSLAIQTPSDTIIMFAGGNYAYPAGASPVVCTIATNSDGTCPMTCTVNGYTVTYITNPGYLAIGTTEDATGTPGAPETLVSLYAIGSAS